MTSQAAEPADVLARIDSVNVGLPRTARLPAVVAAEEESQGTYTTAIAKAPVRGPVAVRLEHLDGDAQADTKHHGGVDKAVHAHFVQHLGWWGQTRGWPVAPGEIGENLTLGAEAGRPHPDEVLFCIGDVVAAGTVVFQVTQPRIPCFKQAGALQIADAVRRAGETGRTGMYLRVLREGTVQTGDALRLVQRPNPLVTVADANRFIHRARGDAELRTRLSACAGLGAELRRLLGSTAQA